MKRKYKQSEDKILHRSIEGNKFRHVDKFIDFPVTFLGPRHRVLFHTPKEALPLSIISEYLVSTIEKRKPEYPNAMIASLIHIAIDYTPKEYKKLLARIITSNK